MQRISQQHKNGEVFLEDIKGGILVCVDLLSKRYKMSILEWPPNWGCLLLVCWGWGGCSHRKRG